jgi:hypothetical protein
MTNPENKTMRYAYPEVNPVSRDRLCELLDFVIEAFNDPDLAPNFTDLARDHVEALKELILLRDVCGTAYEAAL